MNVSCQKSDDFTVISDGAQTGKEIDIPAK
jgi:hypothetical protein